MEYKIETDLNGETHLVKYDNDDGKIILTDTMYNCIRKLKEIIKSRHRETHITFSQNEITDHSNNNKKLSCKEFCGF
jgi:hypothetical protein